MPKRKPIPVADVLPGLSVPARKLFLLLRRNGLLSEAVAFSLAQAVASAPLYSLTIEQILLCVVSDYMAPMLKSRPGELSFPHP